MTNRITLDDIRQRISTLHHVAESRGLTVINSHGSTVASLYVIRSSGLTWLKGEAGDMGGSVDICRPGSNREIMHYLQGMIDALNIDRFN